MRLLADMGVDVCVVEWLRRQGHDAIHLRDQALHRMPNGEIFAKAITERLRNPGIVSVTFLLGEPAAIHDAASEIQA